MWQCIGRQIPILRGASTQEKDGAIQGESAKEWKRSEKGGVLYKRHAKYDNTRSRSDGPIKITQCMLSSNNDDPCGRRIKKYMYSV